MGYGGATSDRQSEARCERKYPLSAAELLEVRWWQRAHGHRFERAYPSRDVSNVYFDSPDWGCYADNLSGITGRAKCRLRWYGGLRDARTMSFEVKYRRNAVGGKRQQSVAITGLALASLPIGGLYRWLRPRLQGELRLWLDEAHRPVLYNRYRREYYATSAGIRMTIDTGIVYALLHGGSLEALHLVPGAPSTVLEVKYPVKQRREAEEALRRLPLRATRCSKYVLGMHQLLA
jgi:hypothetical protein